MSSARRPVACPLQGRICRVYGVMVLYRRMLRLVRHLFQCIFVGYLFFFIPNPKIRHNARALYARFEIHLSSLSLVSFLWDIGKQHSPRWDAAERGVPSGAIQAVCLKDFHKNKKKEKKIKITPNAPKNESGLIHLKMMDKSIRQVWVNRSNLTEHLPASCTMATDRNRHLIQLNLDATLIAYRNMPMYMY